MTSHLITIIESDDPDVRNTPLERPCRDMTLSALLNECAALDRFRHATTNLYHRVRALFFLSAIHRFYLPRCDDLELRGLIPFDGYDLLLSRRFEEAILVFLAAQEANGPSDAISSALSAAYHALAFQTLADQVRRSVQSSHGNQWMFSIDHSKDQPLRIRPELLAGAPYPLLREQTPVRVDLTHSAWSDIFFLGMDYPEAAKVLNVSVDLAVHGRDGEPQPPIETFLRVIDEPLLRLTSVDLGATADITELAEVFDYAKDYLGLLKAAVIASGTVPPGIEGSGEDLADLLATMAGPGRGLEIVSHVHGIPKGSRLAVSTNLLASLITVCMRATGQTTSMEGVLSEDERRLAAARAILGEWLGGSGGGWQDSGGLWPGMKLITGQRAEVGDPEYGISRGRLLPGHRVLGDDDANPEVRRELRDSLVLVHGGMAQNVGPVLEMVTEKYLLRSQQEWDSRQEALGVLTSILAALKNGDVAAIGAATSHNFEGPIQGIIPWASNEFTERVIRTVRERHGAAYLGFCMLGGMTGGGMGFLFKPDARPAAQEDLLEIMTTTKRDLESGLPFAMDPVVYDFEINERGTECSMLRGDARLPSMRHIELDRPGSTERTTSLSQLLEDGGFDRISHEEIRADLREGRIGLAQNRLPAHTDIRDAEPSQVIDALGNLRDAERKVGEAALAAGEVAVVTLAAGTGSRWTQGAGVVKALNPFCRLAGAHRTFLEVHLAKSRRTGLDHGQRPLHVFTTSLFTHDPIAQHLVNRDYYGYREHLRLSLGRAVGLRLVPMERDLRFAWEETPQQLLDTQAQKVQDSLRSALIGWARDGGEGSDYTDNLPLQCIHPVGHWFEIPNLLRNGVLTAMLEQRPQLRYLLLHNIDTLGADLDPGLLGTHIERGSCLSFEVTPRHMEDRGGGLASVDGRPRLIEGLAMPHKEDEFGLSYYNSLTTWIDLDALLSYMGLTRGDLGDTASVDDAVRKAAARMPTYIALKDVKKRWGHGQEDVFPVTQFEKLWGDMSAIADIDTSFFVVPRSRGQQLKDPHQLDGWLRDGSAAHVETLCQW